MKIIGIGLQKGGVGKTSVTLALAAELAKDFRVLIVDADPQGNATCALLSEIKNEFADVLYNKAKVEDAIVSSPYERISVLPTRPMNDSLRNYKVSGNCAQDVYLVADTLKNLENNFDYIIIDTSPDFSIFEQNCFMACDEIIPVINCDTFGSDGLTIFLSNVAKFKKRRHVENLKVENIVINKFNRSMKLDKSIKETIEKSDRFHFYTIPQDQAVKEAQAVQKLLEGKAETMDAIKKIAEAVR